MSGTIKTTLVIMAAGIGSRFGGGVKQLAPIGLNGELIIDYSIHDAIEAGFNKIVFIIRRDIEQDFRDVIGDRIEKICGKLGVTVAYTFQALDDLPAGYTVPEGRKKPWGTGQAVLTCKGVVNEPFAVVNADDYYGKEAYVKIHDFLVEHAGEETLCMAGFILKNTLSDHGGVTRGLCHVNEDGWLTDVVETKNIVKTPTGAAVNGESLDPETHVSMNMWGLTPAFIELLEEGFLDFLANLGDNGLTGEYLLPILIGRLLQEQKVAVRVLETSDKWFGVTYQPDRQMVIDAMQDLIRSGRYSVDLFSDLPAD